MQNKQILVHYGELSTKGKNKHLFINRLADHIRQKTKHLEGVKVSGHHDFMYVSYSEELEDEIIKILAKIPGIQSYAPVYKIDRTIEAIEEMADWAFSTLDTKEGETFCVKARRSDREFPYNSMELQRNIGGYIGDNFPTLSVDLDEPTYTFRIHVQKDGIYISFRYYDGLGGLPHGSSGRGMLMLSGGFDSPVAGYQMLKRGMNIAMVHFSSPPYTGEGSLLKAKKLTAQLANYSTEIKFYNVHFTKIQEEIKRVIPDGHTMTINRRMMLRIVDKLLYKHDAQAIITGESLGQVASQTLDSMQAINAVTNTPVLRPLIATDKNEIIEIAREIGTHDISNEAFEDCCTVFAPQKPRTQPIVEEMEELEKRLDIDAMVQEAVDTVEYEVIDVGFLDELTADFSDLL